MRRRKRSPRVRASRPLSRFTRSRAKPMPHPCLRITRPALRARDCVLAFRVPCCRSPAVEVVSVAIPEPAAPAAARDAFWGELAPCDHLVQIYDDESRFIETLERFIGDGLVAGEATVVIATASHLTWLESRLREAGHDIGAARADDQFIALDAASTLAEFMVDGWPDEARFFEVIGAVIARAKRGGRGMRAFGEMVALLWAQGHNGATVRLEHLWNALIQEQSLALFCAYPRIGATRDLTEALAEVCAAHSKVCMG